MKYIGQFALIMTVSFLGEVCKSLIPLPVPASIYGLILMFAGLGSGIIKLNQVKETAKFLTEIMPLMFIPAAAGLLQSWTILRPVLVPALLIILMSTIAVMVVSGRVTQYMVRRANRTEKQQLSGK